MRQNNNNGDNLRIICVGNSTSKLAEDLFAENQKLRDALEIKKREVEEKDEDITWLVNEVARVDMERKEKDVIINSIKDKFEEEIEKLNKEWQSKMDFLRSLFPKS